MISGLYTAISGMRAASAQVETSAQNTANTSTDGYKKSRVHTRDAQPGVIVDIQRDQTPGAMVPEQGQLVEQSNVDLAEETTQSMIGSRVFQANLKMVQTHDEMLSALLDMKK